MKKLILSLLLAMPITVSAMDSNQQGKLAVAGEKKKKEVEESDQSSSEAYDAKKAVIQLANQFGILTQNVDGKFKLLQMQIDNLDRRLARTTDVANFCRSKEKILSENVESKFKLLQAQMDTLGKRVARTTEVADCCWTEERTLSAMVENVESKFKLLQAQMDTLGKRVDETTDVADGDGVERGY